MIEVLLFIANVVTLACIWFIGKHPKAGYILGVVGNVFYVWAGVLSHLFGIWSMSATVILIYVYHLINLARKQTTPKHP